MVQEHAHDYADVPPEPHRRAHGAKPAGQGPLIFLLSLLFKNIFPLPPTFQFFSKNFDLFIAIDGCIKF